MRILLILAAIVAVVLGILGFAAEVTPVLAVAISALLGVVAEDATAFSAHREVVKERHRRHREATKRSKAHGRPARRVNWLRHLRGGLWKPAPEPMSPWDFGDEGAGLPTLIITSFEEIWDVDPRYGWELRQTVLHHEGGGQTILGPLGGGNPLCGWFYIQHLQLFTPQGDQLLTGYYGISGPDRPRTGDIVADIRHKADISQPHIAPALPVARLVVRRGAPLRITRTDQ